MSTMLGLLFHKPEDFGAANFVMDFQMDIIDINNANILIKKGPNLDKLDKHDKNHIASTIMELWEDTNTNTLCMSPNSIKKFLCLGCCIYIILLICMIGVLESHLPIFKTDKIKQIVAIALGLVSVIVLAIILFGMLFVMQQRLAVKEKWRHRFVNNLCSYLEMLKQQYPNLTFSILYPMHIYSRRIKTSRSISPPIHYNNDNDNDNLNYNANYNDNDKQLRGDEYISAIWCYLRVSEGSIVTSDVEPIYQSTHVNMRRESFSDFSRITGITGQFSLQIEDDVSNKKLNTKKRSTALKTKKTKNTGKASKKGSVQTGRFPMLAKKMGYKQLT